MDETGNYINGTQWPGLVVRQRNTDKGKVQIGCNGAVGGGEKLISDLTENMVFVIERTNGILTIRQNDTVTNAGDFSTFKSWINVPVSIGCGLDGNKQPFRFFKGVMSNIKIELAE